MIFQKIIYKNHPLACIFSTLHTSCTTINRLQCKTYADSFKDSNLREYRTVSDRYNTEWDTKLYEVLHMQGQTENWSVTWRVGHIAMPYVTRANNHYGKQKVKNSQSLITWTAAGNNLSWGFWTKTIVSGNLPFLKLKINSCL